MSLTTSDNVALFLNKTTLTMEESALVDLLITMVDGVVSNYCGWNVEAKDYTKTFSGTGSTILDLKVYPVNQLTSLVIDGTELVTATTVGQVTTYTSDAIINSEDGELYFDSTSGRTFTSGTRNIVAQYNAGFATIPDDLVFAATWLVVYNFKRVDSNSIGILEEKFNDIAIKYDSSDIPVLVKHTLDRYRYISIY